MEVLRKGRYLHVPGYSMKYELTKILARYLGLSATEHPNYKRGRIHERNDTGEEGYRQKRSKMRFRIGGHPSPQ
jgi:hypothetical protein